MLYLLFNEGYNAHAGDDLIREDPCGEALRLGRLVAQAPHLATAPAAHALVALMAFQTARRVLRPARRAARVDPARTLAVQYCHRRHREGRFRTFLDWTG